MRYEHYQFGTFVKSSRPMTPEEARDIVASARSAGSILAGLSTRSILEVLHQTALKWLDPSYRWRRKAIQHMPSVVGFHPDMVEMAIEALAEMMLRPNMEKKLQVELGGADYLDGWKFHGRFGSYMHAVPVGVIFHVSPGNVFVGAADSLVCGLGTKNATILKVASGDPIFPLLFVRSLQESDPTGEVAGSIAVLQFPGGSEQLEAVFKTECDGLVVWGGENAASAYRQGVPQSTRVNLYGPRYSIGVFTKRGLRDTDLAAVCRSAATDVAMWEQRACSSPQIFFVEEGEKTEAFVEELERGLQAVSVELPQATLSTDEKVEILKAREMARMDATRGETRVRFPPRDTSWTLIYEPEGEGRELPQGAVNRVIYVRRYRKVEDLEIALRPLARYLQTAAVQAAARELPDLARVLARAGLTRITRVGEMATGKVGAPHDGTWQLQDLVRWVAMEWVKERFDLGVRLTPDSGITKWEKLQRLARYARENSPFYKERFVQTPLDSPHDVRNVSLLDRHDIYQNTPPMGTGLLTAPLEKAYVFASGGSTGAPKFSFYTYEEFDQVTSILAEMYQVAGIEASDIVGNLFMAGNLWTSFIVANEALAKVGCVTLPIAGNADVDLVLRYLQLFHPTALLGLPSILIQIAEEVERKGLDIQVQKVLYGGEHMSTQARALLRRVLGVQSILSAGYASVDAGPIGYQCHHTAGTRHHLLYDYQYMEIIDPETLQVQATGDTGEIVVTNMDRLLMPMIRFRTGDRGRRVRETCGCGRRTPMFDLLGRCDDVVRVGSVSIYPDDIGLVLAQVPGASQLFQIVADRDGLKDRLTVRAEITLGSKVSGNGAAESLRNAIYERLLADNGELQEALREGWLGSLVVEVVPPGGIPRIRRTGKIKKVVDLR